MYIAPFLKYLKPFTGRLTLAVLCMVLVGALSAGPLLLVSEVIDILSRTSGQQSDVPSEVRLLAGMPHGQDGQTKEPSKLDEIKTSLRRRLDAVPAFARARTWTDAKVQWYRQASATRPQLALAVLASALVAMILLKGIAEFTSKYHLAHSIFLGTLKLREDIFRNVLRQDYLFFNRHSVGLLHSRVNSDAKAVGDILESLLLDGFQQPVNILFMFAVLLILSWKLTLGVLIVVPVIAGVLYYFAKILRKNTRKQKRKADQLSSVLTESLGNIRLVKAFGTEELEGAKFHSQTMSLFRFMMARRLVKFGSSPIMEAIGSVVVAAVLMIGGWMIFRAEMTLGNFIAFAATLSRFYRPIRGLASMTNKYQIARVSAERMIEMLSLAPAVREADGARPFARLERGIELRAVGFRYGEAEVLRGVTLRVRPGECVAFAGPSGSGKTTLVNMIARLFDPTAGEILVDGVDLREYRLADWRARLGMVTQDTFLFEDTIANNIAYGSPAVDPARVESAARAANAHEFIMGLDGGLGYQTLVGPSGARLSGGQRQRLAIARALYRDPQILILDEATSALDEQSQAIVQDALARLMQGRTTFVIAHRISTIQHADCIYVLEAGRIVESGRHDDLIARGGVFAALAAGAARPGDLPESPGIELEEKAEARTPGALEQF